MKVRINWKNEDPQIVTVKGGITSEEILKIIQEEDEQKRDFEIEIQHKVHGWMNDHDYSVVLENPRAFKPYLILARLIDDKVTYMQTHVEVVARSWEAAYEKIRENGFTPYIDEYKPTPAR